MVKRKTTELETKRTKVQGRQKFDTDKYSDVVGAAELADVSLVACDFKIQPEYYEHKGLQKKGSGKLKFAFGCSCGGFYFDPKLGLVGGEFAWSLTAKAGRKHLAKLRCVYICYYTGLEGRDKAAALAFLKRVGRFATYPYFRALASQFSWGSEADFPLLPVIREPKSPRTVKKPPKKPAKKD